MNRRVICCFIVLLAIPTGIVWRSLPLPFFAWKYGGSALWTVALYFIGFFTPLALYAIEYRRSIQREV